MATDYPLTGLKVLDFSRVLSGPFAGRMLCDLGAEVVKVEPPDGDVTRYWGKVIGGIPGYYSQQNAGKRNVCIDLRAPGAADLAKALVAEADILIENYRPDVMPRLGLGYEILKAINPGLIMLSISGFGASGEEMRRPAYAPVLHAEMGLMHRQARRNQADFSELPLSVADTNAALHGLVGVLAAVILRQRTGLGQHIDIAMADATTVTDDQLHFDLEDALDTAPLRPQVWDTPLGPVLLSTDFRVLWKKMTVQLGVVDPANDVMPLAEKITRRHEVAEAYFRDLADVKAFEAVMGTLNIAWGRVRDPATLTEQPTLKHRGSITRIDDRAGGTRPITQSPYRFSNAVSGVRGPAPHRGEHNAEVLQDWLGHAAEAIDALRGAGVLHHDEQWVQP